MSRRDDEGAAAAIAAVKEVYSDLAARPVERSCSLRTECCRFQLTGKVPHLTAGEALLAARAFRATGRKALPAAADGSCPLLNPQNGKCLIYESRPFGCRTHFCSAAGGPYARRDVLDLIRRLEAIGRSLGAPEARPLEHALREALTSTR